MNWVDVVILAILFISALIGLFRGFVREAVSLASWVIAFGVAITYAERFSGMLGSWIASPIGRWTAAFVLIIVLTLALGTIVNFLAGRVVDKAGLTQVDRSFGAAFGVMRGVVIVLVVLVGANFMGRWLGIPLASLWDDSVLVTWLEPVARALAKFVPERYAGLVTF